MTVRVYDTGLSRRMASGRLGGSLFQLWGSGKGFVSGT